MKQTKMAEHVGVTELSNGKDFEPFTKQGLVLVDFWAEWCMPCVMMAPIMDELSEKFKGKIKFGKINVEDHQDIAQKFSVSSIPNFIMFKNGKQVGQFIGSMSSEDFAERLEKFV